MEPFLTATIIGQLYSKANSRQVTRSGKVIKSANALAYIPGAVIQLKAAWKGRAPIAFDVYVRMKIYYPDRRQDMDESLFLDLLQMPINKPNHVRPGAGIIVNDRQIKEKWVKWYLDKDHPRVEFELWEVVDGETDNANRAKAVRS